MINVPIIHIAIPLIYVQIILLILLSIASIIFLFVVGVLLLDGIYRKEASQYPKHFLWDTLAPSIILIVPSILVLSFTKEQLTLMEKFLLIICIHCFMIIPFMNICILKLITKFTTTCYNYSRILRASNLYQSIFLVAKVIILKQRVNLLAINFFVIGALRTEEHLREVMPFVIEPMMKAHTLLYQYLFSGMPYSEILNRMHAIGYECTPDDLIFWGKAFVDARTLSIDQLNNDLGYCQFSQNSLYRGVAADLIDNPEELHRYYPNTPRPYTYTDQPIPTQQESYQNDALSTSTESSSDMDITWDFSELYSLIGFMGTLIFSITFAVVIEYIKAKFDNEDSNNEDQSKDEDSKIE